MGRRTAAALMLVLSMGVWIHARQTRSEMAAAARFIEGILDDFDRGDYKAFDMRLRAALSLPASSLAAFTDFMERDSDGWIGKAPLAQRARRRVVVAAVSLDAANLWALRDWPAAKRLLDWASGVLQKNPERLEAERGWHRASIALIEGANDAATLKAHVDRALDRFPDDHSFVLARAVAAELHTWPDLRDGRTPRQRNPSACDLATTQLSEALRYEDTHAEAEVRLAYLALRNGDRNAAVRQLRDAADTTHDAFVAHLARLFEGRALEQMNRLDEAIVAYRAAVASTPGQTAELALATALFKEGDATEAAKIAQNAARGSLNRPDPWVLYGRGEARHWAGLAEALRRELQ